MNTAVGEKERQTKSKAIPAEHLIPAVKNMLDEGRTATFRIRGRSMRPFWKIAATELFWLLAMEPA